MNKQKAKEIFHSIMPKEVCPNGLASIDSLPPWERGIIVAIVTIYGSGRVAR